MDKIGLQKVFSDMLEHEFEHDSGSGIVTENLGNLINIWYFNTNDDGLYTKLYAGVMSFIDPNNNNGFAKLNGQEARILMTLGDGHVVIDSSKDEATNTYDNYLEDAINENHNSRVSIMTALMNNSGIAFEEKRSSSDQNYQIYMSVRVGTSPSVPAGVIRLSYVSKDFVPILSSQSSQVAV